MSERIVADASAIAVPVQLFISGSDVVVRHGPQHRFFEALPHPLSERHVLPGFFHDTFGERDREQVFTAMRAFIDSVFAPPRERGTSRLPAPVRSALLWADRLGPSARTYRQLEAPLPLSSPRGLGFRLLRRLLPLAARPDPQWDAAAPDPATSSAPWRIYNIGNNRTVELNDFIAALEEALGRKARRELLPMQPGDVRATWADIDDLAAATGFAPLTPLKEGMAKFVSWFKEYYKYA